MKLRIISSLFLTITVTLIVALSLGTIFVQAAKTPQATTDSSATSAPGPRIPILLALERSVRPASPPVASFRTDRSMAGAGLYALKCAGCHGDNGEGKPIRVINVTPYKYLNTTSLVRTSAPWLRDQNKFAEIVTKGLPGYLMPGQGTLSRQQMDDLYAFVRAFAAGK